MIDFNDPPPDDTPPVRIEPDLEQLALFINTVFGDASEGGVVSLRAFYDDKLAQQRDERPVAIRSVKLNGAGTEAIVKAAAKMAAEILDHRRPTVFAPPVTVFKDGKASEANILEGRAILVDVDETSPGAALAFLRGILGEPTFVVESGGQWADPVTGKVQPRLHLYWVLSESTQTPEEHAKLKRARDLACELVGADTSSNPVSHCIRWPGSVHRKDPGNPKLCRIVDGNPNARVNLEDALAELEGAATLRGIYADEPPPRGNAAPGHAGAGRRDVGDGKLTDDELATCGRLIENTDLDWHGWTTIGLAFWLASDGSEAGFAAFDAFSRRSAKYDAAATRERWAHFATSPPDRITGRTLVWKARKADPTAFKRKRTEVPPDGDFPGGAEGQAGAAGDADWEERLATAIGEMNARYFVAMQGGRSLICSLAYDDAMKRERLIFSRRDDIKLQYAHRHYQTGFTLKGTPIWDDLGSAWIADWRRQTYDRIALMPNGATPPGVYNLWRGWGVEPKPGGWPLFRQHLLAVVCCGDQTSFDYLVGWFAHCVQRPERHAETAVVLRGPKGAGKGTVGQALMRIFRSHALQISNSKHLTGHFNAHLADVLFLFLDEAFWGGDKQGEGVLKALITEPAVMIEPKGVDAFAMPNRLKILMSSNSDWVVPATADERRYLVLDVSDERCGDYQYFDSLNEALDGGEMAAFFDHLLKLDLNGFNIRAVPHTKGLNRQKLVGADSVTSFWLDCLREGAIVGSSNHDWPLDVATGFVHEAYLCHARNHGERHPDTDAEMARKLAKLWKGCVVGKRRLPSLTPREARPWGYRLDTLAKHRAAFAAAMRMTIEEMDCHKNEGADHV